MSGNNYTKRLDYNLQKWQHSIHASQYLGKYNFIVIFYFINLVKTFSHDLLLCNFTFKKNNFSTFYSSWNVTQSWCRFLSGNLRNERELELKSSITLPDSYPGCWGRSKWCNGCRPRRPSCGLETWRKSSHT